MAYARMTSVMENRATVLNSWLDQRLEDLSLLSKLPAIREEFQNFFRAAEADLDRLYYRKLLRDSLNLVSDSSVSYERIYVVSPSGRTLRSTLPSLEGDLRVKEEAIVQQVPEIEGPEARPVYYLPELGWHIRLSAPVRDQNEQTLGFIMAVLNLSKLINPMLTHHGGLGETGETYLVDKDGRMITESRFFDQKEALVRSFDTFGIRSALEGTKGTSTYRDYLGREVLGSYEWLPRYGLGLVAEIEMDEIMAPLLDIKLVGILTAGIVAILCFLVAYLVSRRVSEPIQLVANTSQRIAAGDFDQRINFSSSDEVGILADSFNAMAKQISVFIDNLREKEESLQIAYATLVTTQEQLVVSEKMATVGELVASVAHEMRNPLSSVKLNLQIIGRSLDRDTILLEHYRIALDQVLQLERMFTDLLNYSKPLALDKGHVLLEDLVDRSLNQLQDDIISRGIAVTKKISADLPPIWVDAEKMQQVLVNLLRNAVEAVEDDRRIEISASTQNTGEEPLAKISIRDHGVGIASKNLPYVFQTFFTTKKKGTGLGLCIAKKITDAHQGAINLVSEEGSGTEVLLALPVGRGLS
jgi:signal transduction histidine kinase